MKGYDQIKENCSLCPWGRIVPILKMSRFSRLLRLSSPPEMGEMAQTFMSEIEFLAALKCRATGLSTSLFLTERRGSANLSDRRRPGYKAKLLINLFFNLDLESKFIC